MPRPRPELPIPRLDDRTARELYAEAVRLVDRYAGEEWTNRGPSDPGMTLIEVFSWLTDVMLYRLNRVPDRNYLAFLDLLGVRLRPPQPATTLVTFTPTRSGAGHLVPPRTALLTSPKGSEEPLRFETTAPLLLSGSPLERVIAWAREGFDSVLEPATNARWLRPFGGSTRVDRWLYVGDDRLATLMGPAVVTLEASGALGREGRLGRLLEWEYGTEEGWAPVPGTMAEPDARGRLRLGRLPELRLRSVTVGEDEVRTAWLRARLAKYPDDESVLELDDLTLSVEVVGTGIQPQSLLASPATGVFVPLEAERLFLPFGEQPAVDACLYIGAPELRRRGAVRLEFQVRIPPPGRAPRPRPSEDLLLAWEFWNGDGWQEVAVSSQRLVLVKQGPFDFVDSTEALSRSGTVGMTLPPDAVRPRALSEGGDELPWFRVRLVRGDYGHPPSFRLVGDQWLEEEVRPLRPPVVDGFGFQFRGSAARVERAVVEADFAIRDVTPDLGTRFEPFRLFARRIEDVPALYLGFARPLEPGRHALWFEIAEQTEQYAAAFEDRIADQRVRWEYLGAGETWQPLDAMDETLHLKRSGFLTLQAPQDQAVSNLFDTSGCWLRARLAHGGHDETVRLRRVLQNTVAARHQVTVHDEPRASSDGLPGQEIRLRRGPVLGVPEVWVREQDRPGDCPADSLREDPDGGWWVRWECVPRFVDSGPNDRHLRVDLSGGRLLFGDGRRGRIPPAGSRNIEITGYRVGGGAQGNVGAFVITRMHTAAPGVATVSNPVPAVGGAEAETLDELRERGTATVYNQQRAVRAEDFEWLTRQASGKVARVRCLPPRGIDDPVDLVVLPQEADEDAVPRPSRELVRRIEAALQPALLVNTRVRVRGPNYVGLKLQLDLYARAAWIDTVPAQVERALRRFLHPLRGDVGGNGWPFGKTVERSDLFTVIEEAPGVQFVADLRMSVVRDGEERRVERLPMDDDALPLLLNVVVATRQRG